MARDSNRTKPSSSCHEESTSRLSRRRIRGTYDVRNLAERLVGNVAGRLVPALHEVDVHELEWRVRLVENHCDALGARRHRASEEGEDHGVYE
jgi:hypothetical protein